MPTLELKPTHKVVTAYYDYLAKFARLSINAKAARRRIGKYLLNHPFIPPGLITTSPSSDSGLLTENGAAGNVACRVGQQGALLSAQFHNPIGRPRLV